MLRALKVRWPGECYSTKNISNETNINIIHRVHTSTNTHTQAHTRQILRQRMSSGCMMLLRVRHMLTPAASLVQQTVRHRGKYNVKIPHPRHDIARYLEDLTKPVIVRQLPNMLEQCVQRKESVAKELKFTSREAIEFERFLSKHALGLVQKHEVMLILHKHDCPGEIFRRSKVEFKRNAESVIWNWNTTIMRLLIEENPKYENLYPIVTTGLGRNHYLLCSEKALAKNLQLLRRMPFLVLLGGMVHERLLTRADILNYVKLNTLDEQRAQLCATLNAQLALLPDTLTTPIANLAQSLAQHSKPPSNEHDVSDTAAKTI